MKTEDLRSTPAPSALHSLLKFENGPQLPNNTGVDFEHYLHERYIEDSQGWKRRLYYFAKPMMPRALQLVLRRKYIEAQMNRTFPSWPIEPILVEAANTYLRNTVEQEGRGVAHRIAPWPDGKKFAFAITHDVEWDYGLRNAYTLVEIERKFGFSGSWNIVPERYPIDWNIIKRLRADGFEIGVQGLKHDGKLFASRKNFERESRRIRKYAEEWGASGFRSPSTLRNVDWIPEMGFDYDSSFPDTDPYEPQPGGCCSIWPFFIKETVELPMTMPQDHTLFEILHHKDISVWKQKSDWIEMNSGLILLTVHPDYLLSRERLKLFEDILAHLSSKGATMWHALPRDIARWWRDRDSSTLSKKDGKYVVEGPSNQRASILRTTLENGVSRDSSIPQT